MRITCCHHCVAPKRHLGCHSVCPEYIEQRKQLDEHNNHKSQKYYEESLVPRAYLPVWHDNKRR